MPRDFEEIDPEEKFEELYEEDEVFIHDDEILHALEEEMRLNESGLDPDEIECVEDEDDML